MNKPEASNSLPMINIATPCPMAWDGMSGDQTKRFCDHCTKHVFNFAEMPRDEVQDLVSSGQSVCARVFRKQDGTIVTLEDLSSKKGSKFTGRFLNRRSWIGRAAILAAGILSLVTFGGCDEETVKKAVPWIPEHEQEVTGIVAPGPELGDIAMPETGKIAPPNTDDVEPAEDGADNAKQEE